MNTHEFSRVVNYVKSIKPNWFLSGDEYLASKEDIEQVELLVGGTLPDEYVYFSKNYNAGYFAFVNIYSLNPNSEWYLPVKNKEYEMVSMPQGFIAFSDDETGGYYGFLKEKTQYKNEVYFFDSSGDGSIESIKEDFFEFVVSRGFQPEHFDLDVLIQ